ncbi:MAG: efflux RND transporter periplasmic adaptor subunit [Ideonella sp.]|nr:efflux RND transporter periplasmic adaptor subunit [Ideonella sp.]
MNARWPVAVVLLALAALAAYRWLPQRGSADAPAGGPPVASATKGSSGGNGQAVSVSVFAALQRDVPVTIEAAGTVVSLDTVDVRPQVSGTVAEAVVREGQFVRRGDVLFRLDDRADRANLEKARAQLLRDRALLADLRRQHARAQDLRAQNFIAQSALDTVRAQFESQQAAVAASVAAVRSAEVALSYGTITAPLSGRAGAVGIYRGSLVQSAGNALVTISRIDPIGVAFTVPEAQLDAVLQASGLRRGVAPAAAHDARRPAAPAAAARTAAAAASSAGGGTTLGTILVSLPDAERRGTAAEIVGRITFVDNAVDTSTGTIRVKGELPNADHRLWPGQYVSVRMTLRTLVGAIVIPQSALIVRGNERSVYVVKADGTVEPRAVQPRYNAGELLAIDGLHAGDKVVVEGKQDLRPGSTVHATPYLPAARDPASPREQPAARVPPSHTGASGAASGASGAATGAGVRSGAGASL